MAIRPGDTVIETIGDKQVSGYNGWSNRQTWNVALYVNNEYPIYMAKMAHDATFTAKSAKSFCAEHLGTRTPDGVRLNDSAINWSELAASFNDDKSEA